MTFNELVNAQQNVYNVGYDLSLLLAFLGLQADGDLVTQKLSLGCDATTRTSFAPLLTGSQPGLAGHNKFEADTSLTRNDFFVSSPYAKRTQTSVSHHDPLVVSLMMNLY